VIREPEQLSEVRPVLEAINVYKSYRRGDHVVTALSGVTVTVSAGERVAVMGPSGCGKSTLLHLCGAMDRPSSGEIHLDGQRLCTLDDDQLTRLRRRQVGFVFQSFNLLPTLTIAQNIGLPLLLSGSSEDEARTAAKELAERVGLTRRLDHLPQQLSGGEVQRAAIVRAVIHEPTVLIADEPTGNLDSDNGQRILELLLQLNEQSKTAIIVATHDETVARQLDKVVSLRDGQVLNTSS
jgi:ABC-type lipoprotein export system ATPase subunit